jgi:imidazolonepropionase-like amidohydrolase
VRDDGRLGRRRSSGAASFDGSGRDPIPRGVVVIENDCIRTVSPDSAVTVPRGARMLDAAGLHVLPGMIDCHVHATYRVRNIRRHLLNTPTYNVLRSTTILRETLECGVTTAREMGGADVGFREAVAEDIVPDSRLLTSIVMMCQMGGHDDAWVPAGFRVP